MEEIQDLKLLSRTIARENGVELDFDGCDKLREIIARVGARWPSNAMKVLNERNKPLLEKLSSLESHLDSLLLIPNKPLVLKKELKAKLEEYEKTIGMCIEYSNRHVGSL